MKQYKIGEVFMDTEHFKEPKRVKCVEDNGSTDDCLNCLYDRNKACYRNEVKCGDRKDGKVVHFIETDEPLTEEAK